MKSFMPPSRKPLLHNLRRKKKKETLIHLWVAGSTGSWSLTFPDASKNVYKMYTQTQNDTENNKREEKVKCISLISTNIWVSLNN